MKIRGHRLIGPLSALPIALAATEVAAAITIQPAAAAPPPSLAQWALPVLVSAVVALLVLGVNTWQTGRMHQERLKGENALAERKAAHDLALAREKDRLDRQFADWRRRSEIAEETLALFHEVQDAIIRARSPAGFAGDGTSRKATEDEDEKLKEDRDSYFVPIERLQVAKVAIARLQALRYLFIAYFGKEASKPFTDLFAVITSIQAAVGTLIRAASAPLYAPLSDLSGLKITLWGLSAPDPLADQLDAAMAGIEAICGEILRGKPAPGEDAGPS